MDEVNKILKKIT